MALRAQIVREAKKLKLKTTALEKEPGSSGGGGSGGRGSVEPMSRDALPRGKRDVTQAAPLAPSRTPGWSGREFTSPLGVPILVGRNRKENEQLSLKLCREPDVWMHVRGVPGAHVVLQMSKIKGKEPPSDECMQMAADLAAFYSEARDELHSYCLDRESAAHHQTKWRAPRRSQAAGRGRDDHGETHGQRTDSAGSDGGEGTRSASSSAGAPVRQRRRRQNQWS